MTVKLALACLKRQRFHLLVLECAFYGLGVQHDTVDKHQSMSHFTNNTGSFYSNGNRISGGGGEEEERCWHWRLTACGCEREMKMKRGFKFSAGTQTSVLSDWSDFCEWRRCESAAASQFILLRRACNISVCWLHAVMFMCMCMIRGKNVSIGTLWKLFLLVKTKINGWKCGFVIY